ncbi:hypothetical protein A0J61_09526 [Choanephora cucurbitarum]|uniref:Uncharacterized protein n=1 Tax=Choanephora cucurbitarum TaxID=101091 RepID=A0A1C7N045_9FUNG|nr:hypothetical protein A0J61_09526 [Choanephora cucurbitarum]
MNAQPKYISKYLEKLKLTSLHQFTFCLEIPTVFRDDLTPINNMLKKTPVASHHTQIRLSTPRRQFLKASLKG